MMAVPSIFMQFLCSNGHIAIPFTPVFSGTVSVSDPWTTNDELMNALQGADGREEEDEH